MEFFIEKQLIIMQNSVILGLIFGAFYDIIRISHIICGIASYSGKSCGMKHSIGSYIIFGLMDFIYAVVLSAAFSVFVYWQNNGVVRAFILVPCALGFILYHKTAGRAVMYFSEAVVRYIRLIFRYTVAIPVRFVIRIVKRVLRWVYAVTAGKLIFVLSEAVDGMKTACYLKKFESAVRFDSKIKRKEKK